MTWEMYCDNPRCGERLPEGASLQGGYGFCCDECRDEFINGLGDI